MNKNMRISLIVLCSLTIAEISCASKAAKTAVSSSKPTPAFTGKMPRLYTFTNDQQNQLNSLDNELNPLWNQLSPLQQQKSVMQQKMLDQMFRKQSRDYEKLTDTINSLEQEMNPLRLQIAQIVLTAMQTALNKMDPSSRQYEYLNAQIQGQQQYIQALKSSDSDYLLYGYY